MSIISGAWPPHRNARLGPFEHNGTLYAVTTSPTRLYYSNDDGVSWQNTDIFSSTWTLADVVQMGNTLHMAFISSNAAAELDVAYINLDTWVMSFTTATAGSVFANVSGTRPAFLAVRSNGDRVVFHQAATERVMGTDYRRMAYSIWNGSSWTTSVPAFQAGATTHYDARAAIGLDDRVHGVFSSPGSNLFVMTLSTSNVVSTVSVGSTLSTTNYVAGTPTFNQTLGLLYFPHQATATLLGTPRATPADTLSILSHFINPSTTARVSTSNPAALVPGPDGVHHIFIVYDATGDIYYQNNSSGLWTTPELFATADAQGISAGLVDGGNSIGVLYNDAGTVRFSRLDLAPFEQPTLSSPSHGTTSAQLNWTAVDLADTYELQRKLSSEGDESYTTVQNSAGLSSDDTGLVPGTGYTYRVRGVNTTYGGGPWSEPLQIETLFIALAPTLLTPPSGGTEEGTEFTWQFNADNNVAQDAFAFKARLGDYTEDVPGTPTVTSNARGVSFSPDGNYLAVSLGSSPNMRVFNTSDWSVVPGIFTAGSTTSVAFSPDGAYLAVTQASPSLRVLDTSDWSVVATPSVPSGGEFASWSPDGAYIAVVHGSLPRLTIVNTSDWSVVPDIYTPPHSTLRAAFSPDGAFLAVTHLTSPRLAVLDTSDWSVVSPSLPANAHGVAFSPDGNYLVTIYNDNFPRLRVMSTSDWSLVTETSLPSIGYGVAFSPDGSLLAVGINSSPFLHTIKTSDWSVVPNTPVLSGVGNDVDFSSDGVYIAIAQDNSPFLRVIEQPSFWWDGVGWSETEVFIESSDEQLILPASAWGELP